MTLKYLKELKNKLSKDLKVGDKYIYTSHALYKIRKNGKYCLSIGSGINQEIVRVSLV